MMGKEHPMVAINPMRVPGSWRLGYVLDYHTLRSDFLGYDAYGHPMFDTKRSEIGDLLYKLKYRGNQSVLNTIADTAAEFLRSWNPRIDAIVPVPPTRTNRIYQPVTEVAKALSARLSVPIRSGYVIKTKATPELKSVYDYNTRLRLLEDAFEIQDQSLEAKSVLLFDDLYRSGATLTAITDILYSKAKVADVYVFALTRTRSAS